MKKQKESTKIIVGMVIGLILSTASYVLAENLINSKDVVYEDNSNLVADNVQDAIDGTCTKIDTRLSDIEDKLYTIKKIYIRNGANFTTESSYSGTSITLPANSYCSLTIQAHWNNGIPVDVTLTTSPTENTPQTRIANGYKPISSQGQAELTKNMYIEKEVTYYVWAQYDRASLNTIYVDGFCATKYK